jgi:hypothetical protein
LKRPILKLQVKAIKKNMENLWINKLGIKQKS